MNTLSELADTEKNQLRSLFKRRKISQLEDFPVLKGRYGYIRHDGTKLGVVVIADTMKLVNRTQRILGENSGYTIKYPGEFLIRLDFSDTNRALLLVGLTANRH